MSSGLLLRYEEVHSAIHAAHQLKSEGISNFEAHGPFPDEELIELTMQKRSVLPLVCLVGGIIGLISAYALQYYTSVIQYPHNVGGRPLHSWPAFIPVTFELTVLFAAIAVVIAFFTVLKLPAPHHPLFDAPSFERVSDDQFFLYIRDADLQSFSSTFMERLGPSEVTSVST